MRSITVGPKIAPSARKATMYTDEVGRHKAQGWYLEQPAGDDRGVAQPWRGAPDGDAAPAAAREQPLGPDELFRSKVHVVAEAVDKGTPAAAHHDVEPAGPDCGGQRQRHVECPESRQRVVRHRAGEDDHEVGRDR